MLTERIEADITLLLIDDEEVIHRSAGDFLEQMGYKVLHADSGQSGLKLFDEQGADIVITDVRMPGMDGMELLQELGRRSHDIEVILISGHGDMDIAIDALRKGAFDFFRKPIRLEELLAALRRTRQYQEVRREKDRIQQRLDSLLREGDKAAGAHEIIGESRAMKAVMEMTRKVAATDRTTVLIEGDSGTGKELVARAIHDQSARASMPFISVNSTAIPEALLESELFGHEQGAFTDASGMRRGMFELANGGTLFLDEIGDMSLTAQAKILRVIEERRIRRVGGTQEIEVDVRLVSATNQDLTELVAQRRFRQDLYFRLNVFTIQLPSLPDRGDDVLLLAYRFLGQYASELRKDVTRIEPCAQALLRSYSFPGNVRELRNLIERAVILCEHAALRERDFPDLAAHGAAVAVVQQETAALSLAQLEEQAIRNALQRAGGRQVEAAQALDIGQDALRRRMKKYRIDGGWRAVAAS